MRNGIITSRHNIAKPIGSTQRILGKLHEINEYDRIKNKTVVITFTGLQPRPKTVCQSASQQFMTRSFVCTQVKQKQLIMLMIDFNPNRLPL